MFCILSGCDVRYDVGFALDGSNSIDRNEYRLTKDFVKDIIKAFSISEDGTHVAILEYASDARIKAYFDDEFYDPNELLNFVEDLDQAQGAATNIGRGLDKTLEMFSTGNGMRGDEVSSVV